jgi:hypothetical protein
MLFAKLTRMSNIDKKPRHDTDSGATLWAGVHRIYLPTPLDASARAEVQTRVQKGAEDAFGSRRERRIK